MWKWSTYRPQMTAYLSLWSISEGSPEHRTDTGIFCRVESSQVKHYYSCYNLEKLNWPILDSTLVKIVRMLRANSSAKVLFLATAIPSPGSSNLCSTQACHRGVNIISYFIFLGHKKHHREGIYLEYHAIQQLSLKLEQELLKRFQLLFRNGEFPRVMVHRF